MMKRMFGAFRGMGRCANNRGAASDAAASDLMAVRREIGMFAEYMCVIPSVGIPGLRPTAGKQDVREHVILRREDAEGSQDARLSHFEILRRAAAGSG